MPVLHQSMCIFKVGLSSLWWLGKIFKWKQPFNEKFRWYRVTVLGKCPLISEKMLRNCWNTYIYISIKTWRKSLPNIWDIGVSVDKNDIDDCHRLREKDQTIVKFLQRKDCKQVLRCKKDLRSVNMSNLDLPKGTKMFINESLCRCCKDLWGICK